MSSEIHGSKSKNHISATVSVIHTEQTTKDREKQGSKRLEIKDNY
jgi:hypothetical protein